MVHIMHMVQLHAKISQKVCQQAQLALQSTHSHCWTQTVTLLLPLILGVLVQLVSISERQDKRAIEVCIMQVVFKFMQGNSSK